jgi:hypothetical protein
MLRFVGGAGEITLSALTWKSFDKRTEILSVLGECLECALIFLACLEKTIMLAIFLNT